MPTLLTTAPEIPPAPVPPRKRWTREQCAALEASGVWAGERLELVGGELISKMGKNRPHVNLLAWMYRWLMEAFGQQFVLSEAPIDVHPSDNPSSEPEPDLTVLKRAFASFKSGNPKPEDISLLVEISDSTLEFDLNVKAALYARAGISEYWVLDVNARRLICHRSPVAGKYSLVNAYSELESVAPLAAPHALFSASQIFTE